MAQRSEILTVYAAGLIQGVALVTFPAASAVFTSSSDYGLSSTEYGGMFVPQAVTAIISSLVGASLRKRLGTKRIYMMGLFANLLAMSLLVVSRFVMKEHSLAYAILLVATACMGIAAGQFYGRMAMKAAETLVVRAAIPTNQRRLYLKLKFGKVVLFFIASGTE